MASKYENMSWLEIHKAYFIKFGECFGIPWDDDRDHRDEMIMCLESGKSQRELGLLPSTSIPEGCVA